MFVFLDDRPSPFLVRQHSDGQWWLYYWNDGPKNFATLRQVPEHEVATYRERALPKEQAALYLKTVPDLIPQLVG